MQTFVCVLLALQASVTGLVLDPTGAAIAGATVRVEVDGANVSTVQTRDDGSFEWPGEATGAVVLRVSSPGFAESVVRAPAGARGGTPITVVLQPAGVFETVTVTASRSDTRLSTPAAASVLTSVEISTMAAGAVDDALRNTPGFGLTRRSSSRVANPSSQGVSMRGLAGNAGSRTLVLADGLPLNDAFGGWVYWNRVPQAAVERIEVVRGAAGDLYGGDAISGVIQLLTYSPDRLRLRATADAGSANTWRGSIFGGGHRNGWQATVAGEWVGTDGEPIVAEDQRGPIDVPADSDYGTASGTVGYAGDGWRATGRVALYQEVRGNGTPAVTNDTNWRQLSATASGGLAGGLWSAQASAGRQHYFNNFSSVPPSRTAERVTNEQRVPSTFQTAVGQWVRPLGAQVLLVGVEAKRTDATVNDTPFLPDGSRGTTVVTGGVEHVTSTYGRVALHPASDVTIIAGARGDFWRSMSEETNAPPHAANFFSPRLSAAWQATPGVMIRASATHAWRTPTLDELHRSSRIGNTLTLNNAQLDPESLTGFEAGATLTRGSASFVGTWFWNDLTDAITNITLATLPNLITKQKQNADHVRAQGAELDAAFRPAPSITVSAGVVFTSSHFKDEVSQPALEGNQVPQIPAVMFNGAFTWTDPHVTLSAQWRGSSRQFEDDLNTLPLGAYGVLDAYASRVLTRRFDIYAACENVFDTVYQTGKTGNPPITKIGWPRTYRVGLRVALP